MIPKFIKGISHKDSRGVLSNNNDFDAAKVKRVYVIENINTEFLRAWIGHKIQERWFSVMSGSFSIELIAIDNWDFPSKNLIVLDLYFIQKH